MKYLIICRNLYESHASDDETYDYSTSEQIMIQEEGKTLFEGTSPYEHTGFWSRILFLWINPLISVLFTS